MVKKFRADTWHTIEPLLGDTSLNDHTRKQVQMHMAAEGILNRLKKVVNDVKEFFREVYSYDTVFLHCLTTCN